MSDSENISLWKKKAEIDYTSLFVPLWLSFDAWMRDRYNETTDRKRLQLLKCVGHKISDEFIDLFFGDNPRSRSFQGYAAELYRALDNACIAYDNAVDKFISFACVQCREADGRISYVSLLKEGNQQNKIELLDGVWVTSEKEALFSAYIEILYQVRCKLFHGDLKPSPENERVIKYLYLMTSEIMKRV